ncbi:brain-enriched guanylate kinase-associated protein isoform X1 [Lagenorhynchus albirostris]|uniref:brain-enriched guanylate kinase-associated protein isoform X1 n=1 Tax=Lagenorhynchus albirostris TaxID=27610 RepID=UPI0028EE1F1C|nr:brain-enriched guanylate kinase-associated protein isoform X1 [Lagenorhynchus albirostris]
MLCAASWPLWRMLPGRGASRLILSLAQRSHSLLGPHSRFGEDNPGLGCGTSASGPQRPQPALWRSKSGGPCKRCHLEVGSQTERLGADGCSLNQGPLSRPKHLPPPVPDWLRVRDPDPRGGGWAVCVLVVRVRVRWCGLAHPVRTHRRLELSAAARPAAACRCSALQEQKGELRKRLSYTTHKLEKLETEFDSTRHYLEIELRRAQEELEKVTEKLRRIQSNYMALQRINQELEDKLYRMGQHYEEEKRALSHEIVALNSHLLEAKVTIDKLSEDNLPSEFQEHVSLHMEKQGCSLPSPLCRPAYADSVPPCVLAKVLEKPDPGSLSSHLSDASARDLAFRDRLEKPGPRPPYKGDIYCSDTALYCPEERRRDRRPSADGPVTDVGFLRAQNSTDSAAEEEEPEAAAYPAGYRHGAFGGYAASLPTSSSYSSFSAASEEKEHAQASTLTASQQAIYLNSRDELFGRTPPAAYGSSSRYASAAAAVAAPLEAEAAPGFARTVSPYPAEPYRFPVSPGPQPALMPPNLWNLRAKPGSARLAAEDARGQWRPLSVEDIGAYPFPAAAAAAAAAPGRASPGGFNDRYFGAGGGPGEKAEGRASPLYASYKADSFSEGDDLSQGHLAEPRYLRAAGDLSLSPGRSAEPLPSYAASEGERERLGVQLCGAGGSPEPEHSPRSSRDSLEPSSMEASPEMHPGARLSPQPAFPRTGGSGLSRKDSLTKAQLYGTLLN